VRCANDIGSN